MKNVKRIRWALISLVLAAFVAPFTNCGESGKITGSNSTVDGSEDLASIEEPAKITKPLEVESPKDGEIVSSQVSLRGLCEPASEVTVTAVGSSEPEAKVTCSPEGRFVLPVTLKAPSGDKPLQVTQKIANKDPESLSLKLNMDITKPSITISTPASRSEVQAKATLTGKCEASLGIDISGAGLLAPVKSSCTAQGTFSAPVSFTAGNGLKAIFVSQTDKTGNTGTDSITLDRRELVTSGLIVRYRMNEAASGQPSVTVKDSAPGVPLNLVLTYDGADPSYKMPIANKRGLHWSSIHSDARACGALAANSKVLTAFQGRREATVEAIVDFDRIHDHGSRIIDVGFSNDSNWYLSFGASSSPGVVVVGLHNGTLQRYFNFNLDLAAPATGRVHLTAVVDTAQATSKDRVRLYKNAQIVPFHSGDVLALNEVINLGPSNELCLGNRNSDQGLQRSPRGTIHYTALYSRALTSKELIDNVILLGRSDD